MLQIKTTDQFSANFLEMGGDEDISKSSNLSTILDIQMLAKQRVLKEEMLEIDRRIQGFLFINSRLEKQSISQRITAPLGFSFSAKDYKKVNIP